RVPCRRRPPHHARPRRALRGARPADRAHRQRRAPPARRSSLDVILTGGGFHLGDVASGAIAPPPRACMPSHSLRGSKGGPQTPTCFDKLSTRLEDWIGHGCAPGRGLVSVL